MNTNGHIPISQQPHSPDDANSLFTRLRPQDVEGFYQSYRLWSLRQQRADVMLQITALQQQIAENAEMMQRFAPPALALASLAQLQAHGVENIDLLERMLERGETWLDHAMQLLERCEELDVIGGDYTEWCEHALEGAYNWIDSMDEAPAAEITEAETTEGAAAPTGEMTEEAFLQKLMSEEDATEQMPALPRARITQPLPALTASATTDEQPAPVSPSPDQSNEAIPQSDEIAHTSALAAGTSEDLQPATAELFSIESAAVENMPIEPESLAVEREEQGENGVVDQPAQQIEPGEEPTASPLAETSSLISEQASLSPAREPEQVPAPEPEAQEMPYTDTTTDESSPAPANTSQPDDMTQTQPLAAIMSPAEVEEARATAMAAAVTEVQLDTPAGLTSASATPILAVEASPAATTPTMPMAIVTPSQTTHSETTTISVPEDSQELPPVNTQYQYKRKPTVYTPSTAEVRTVKKGNKKPHTGRTSLVRGFLRGLLRLLAKIWHG